MSHEMANYRRKRDMIVAGLAGDYELVAPGGAFTPSQNFPGARAWSSSAGPSKNINS